MEPLSQIVITYLIIVLEASSEGLNKAIIDSKEDKAFKFNDQVIFIFQRLVFGVVLIYAAHWIGMVAGLLSFIFFHNACYYMYRDQINGLSPKQFRSDSINSGIKMNSNLEWSAIMFIAGIATLLTGIYLSATHII